MPRMRLSDGYHDFRAPRRVRVDLDATTYHIGDPKDAPNAVVAVAVVRGRCECGRPVDGPFRNYDPYCSRACLARADR